MIQLFILVMMILGRTVPYVGARMVLLQVEPVDPRDLLRGDYVTLGYSISRLPPRNYRRANPYMPGLFPRPMDAIIGPAASLPNPRRPVCSSGVRCKATVVPRTASSRITFRKGPVTITRTPCATTGFGRKSRWAPQAIPRCGGLSSSERRAAVHRRIPSVDPLGNAVTHTHTGTTSLNTLKSRNICGTPTVVASALQEKI